MSIHHEISTLDMLLEFKYGNIESEARCHFHMEALKDALIERVFKDLPKEKVITKYVKPLVRKIIAPFKNIGNIHRRVRAFWRLHRDQHWLVGQEGVVLTKMSMQGKVEIMGVVYDGLVRSRILKPGTRVKVIDTDINEVIVIPI